MVSNRARPKTPAIVYQAVAPASGSMLTQSFAAPAMGMNFLFDKSTFGQDEVTQTSTWGLAYWLAISGLWRQRARIQEASRSQRAAQSRAKRSPARD